MKVYIVSVEHGEYEYKTEYTYGVYKEKEKAEKTKEYLIKENWHLDCFEVYIEEYEVIE